MPTYLQFSHHVFTLSSLVSLLLTTFMSMSGKVRHSVEYFAIHCIYKENEKTHLRTPICNNNHHIFIFNTVLSFKSWTNVREKMCCNSISCSFYIGTILWISNRLHFMSEQLTPSEVSNVLHTSIYKYKLS